MPRYNDLTGMIFGRLTVLEYLGSDKKGQAKFLCICSCNNKNQIVAYGSSLKSGNTKSCGCYKKERIAETQSNEKDMIGNTFGRLTVIRYFGKEKWGAYKYVCFCSCGNKEEVVVTGKNLKSGHTTSCGCYQKERTSETSSKEKYMIGKVFGMLTVSHKVGVNKRENNIYLCNCSCGCTVISSGDSLNSGKIFSCGCLKDSFIASELKKYAIEKYEAIKEYCVFRNPETEYFLPYDIYIPEHEIYIEVMGQQHYKYNSLWYKTQRDFENQKQRDSIKKQYAEENGYYVEIDLRKIKTIDDAICFLEEYLDGFR